MSLSLNETRLLFALRAKRALGYWIPMNSPIEDADKNLKHLRNRMINNRAGWDTKPSHTQNMWNTVQNARDRIQTLEVYGAENAQHQDRAAKARRVLRRLGYLEPDYRTWGESCKYWEGKFGPHPNWDWELAGDFCLPSGARYSARTVLQYVGFGDFKIYDTRFSYDELKQSGIRRRI